jgi:hypothetical protein
LLNKFFHIQGPTPVTGSGGGNAGFGMKRSAGSVFSVVAMAQRSFNWTHLLWILSKAEMVRLTVMQNSIVVATISIARLA